MVPGYYSNWYMKSTSLYLECVQCDPPLSSYSPMGAMNIIPNMPPPTIHEDMISISGDFRIFIGDILQKEPSQRYSCKQLLQHPIFDDYNTNPQNLRDVAEEALDIWEGWSWEEGMEETETSSV